jgi:DNA polymerase
MNDRFAMSEQQRLAYLQALGIDVWVENTAVDVHEEPTSAPIISQQNVMPAQKDVTDTAEPQPVSEKRSHMPLPEDLGQLAKHVATCEYCDLHKTRTQTVFGVGHPKADWLIIGEAPGADEDKQGVPFVGRAGQLLTQMLRAIGLAREEVFIANILKCRPPNNRDPKAEEIAACHDYLIQQIKLIEPKMILVVGRIAAQSLLNTKLAIGKMRGQLHYYGEQKLPLVVTYHPAYLLRSPGEKRKVWEDLKFARQQMLNLQSS